MSIVSYIHVCIIDVKERLDFMKSINAVERVIDRGNLYEDVIDKGDIVGECPIDIKFVGEKAVDDGGVRRDMFSAFWETLKG